MKYFHENITFVNSLFWKDSFASKARNEKKQICFEFDDWAKSYVSGKCTSHCSELGQNRP
jgi:hypothetical protein